MRRFLAGALCSVVVLGFVSRAVGQTSRVSAASQVKTVSLVEVVGCLANSGENAWQLTNGTEPVVSQTGSTTVEAVKAAEAKPLGKARYTLIGLSLLDPASHKGHKMVVKGLLIKDVAEVRINVISFQMASARCRR